MTIDQLTTLEAWITATDVQLAALIRRVAELEATLATLQAPIPAPVPPPVTQPVPVPTPPPPSQRVYQGVYMQKVPWETALWDSYEAGAGKKQAIVHYGQSWWEGGTLQRYRAFYPNVIEAVRTRGAIPLVDWSPWDTSISPVYTQAKFNLAATIRGDHDAYIRSYISAVKAWGKPVMLRPMHEMNGTWYPWSENRNGNSTGQYVQAWRRIVDVARSTGATNITWVWCCNKIYPGSLPLAGLYPGDDYVDWASIDAYAGDTDFPDEPFTQMLRPTYDAVGQLTQKPIILAEWGYGLAAKRPAWLKDALSRVFDFPRLKAVCYFMWSSPGQWDFRGDAASMAAWKEGLADPRYAGAEFTAVQGKIVPL